MGKLRKRRLAKFFGEYKTKIIFITLFISLMFLSIGYALLNVELTIEGSSSIIVDENCSLNVSGKAENVRTYISDTGFVHVIKFVIMNSGDDDIYNWTIVAEGPADLTIEYGNIEYTINNGVVTMNNLAYNGTIASKESFEIEVAFKTTEQSFELKSFIFNDCTIWSDVGVVDPSVLREIVLTPLQEVLDIGDELSMQATKIPNTAVADFTWSSSDDSIATVDNNGLVTAISPGEAIISVRSGDVESFSQIVVRDEDGGNETPSELRVDVTFNQVAAWSNQMNFYVLIENHTLNPVKSISFDIDLPNGTEYTIWYCPRLIITGNNFSINMDNDIIVGVGLDYKIEGQLTLPSGLASDWSEIQIINVMVG